MNTLTQQEQTILNAGLQFVPQISTITNEVLLENIGRQDLIKGTWLGLITGWPVFALGGTGVNKTRTIRAMANRIDGAIFDDRLIPGVKSMAELFVESTVIEEMPAGDKNQLQKELATISAELLPMLMTQGVSSEAKMQQLQTQLDVLVNYVFATLGKATRLREKLGRSALANIFFGDEFFKDPDHPVLNTLIDYALQGYIRHEGGIFNTPLVLFIAAGNETPDPTGSLGAIWSRMTIRLLANSLDRTQRLALLASRASSYQDKVTGLSRGQQTLLKLPDVGSLRKAEGLVTVSDGIKSEVLDIYDELAARTDVDFSNILGDDRRFVRGFDLMQAHALMQGRSTVTVNDLAVWKWVLWDNEDQIPAMQEVLIPHTKTPLSESQELVNAFMSPTGAFMLAKGGDIRKSVDALAQGQAATKQLKSSIEEATRAGETAMAAEISELLRQVQEEMDSYIGKMTGRR